MLEEMVYQNPHASGKLHYSLIVECNTPDDVILSNVIKNSKKVQNWLKTLPENGRTLLICGSGPSIMGDISIIKKMQEEGADIWALNNCANFLGEIGVTPDAQVIMDARPETINAIGPAKRHLFASQVDPSLFEKVSTAELWHSTHGNVMVDEQDEFPQHEDEYCLIGSSVSVGNTAMILAYSQGYRNIHLFGYDSSNAGASHVIRQHWNDGEPMTIVDFMGKSYVSSLTMKAQADAFHDRAVALEREGCSITVHGYGLLPDRWRASKEPLQENEKYQRMWEYDSYRAVSPGEDCVGTFLEVCKPDGLVIDFGCGTGRAGLRIQEYGCHVVLLDFTENSRDKEAMQLPFWKQDLTKPIIHKAKYGYCTDVMEHIRPDDVDAVINNIMFSAKTTFFQISTVPDTMGALIGQQLHLTVKPHQWWKEKFEALGYSISFDRDDEISSIFVVHR